MPYETLTGQASTDGFKNQRAKVPHLDEDLNIVGYGIIEYFQDSDDDYYVTLSEGLDKFDIEHYFRAFTSNKVFFEIEIEIDDFKQLN